MERLSIDFSNLTLPSMDLLDDETWLCTPTTNNEGATKCKEEVYEWLKGAPTFDFQTRSALSRKLMKRRAKRHRRKFLQQKLPSFSDQDREEDEIDELLKLEAEMAQLEGLDSEPELDLESSTVDGHTSQETAVAFDGTTKDGDNSISQHQEEIPTTSSGDVVMKAGLFPDSDSDSDDLFYDAPDEPEMSGFQEPPPILPKPLPLTEKLNIVVEQPEPSALPPSLSKSYSIDVPNSHLRSSSVSPDTRSSPRSQNGSISGQRVSPRQSRMSTSPRIPMLKQRSTSRPPSLDSQLSEVKISPLKTELSEIERKAKEQEEAIRAQLRSFGTRGRLSSSKSDQNGPDSRPMSASTSSSSTLASSKSVDFKSSNGINGVGISQSASRLPVPARRQGGSRIPIPASVRTPLASKTLARPATTSRVSLDGHTNNLRTTSAQGFYETTPRRASHQNGRMTLAPNHLSLHDNWTDDDCF